VFRKDRDVAIDVDVVVYDVRRVRSGVDVQPCGPAAHFAPACVPPASRFSGTNIRLNGALA